MKTEEILGLVMDEVYQVQKLILFPNVTPFIN